MDKLQSMMGYQMKVADVVTEIFFNNEKVLIKSRPDPIQSDPI